MEIVGISGSAAGAVIKGRFRIVATLGLGCPAGNWDLPLPPRGRPIAVDPRGPSILTDDGVFWLWRDGDNRWERVGAVNA